MSKTIQQLYAERFTQAENKALTNPVYEELQIKMLSDQVLEEKRAMVAEVTGKPVWTDYSFRTGGILGLLRTTFFEFQHREDILKALNLSKAVIDEYYKSVGNMPYLAKDGTLNEGRPMNVERTKDLIRVVANHLGVLVEDDDLDDINEERIASLYARALKVATDTQANKVAEFTPAE